MCMNKFIKELDAKGNYFCNKKKGKIDFGYINRVNLERILFLIAKSFCMEKFNCDLGGLTCEHKIELMDRIEKDKYNVQEIHIINRLFKIYELASELTSSDPYCCDLAVEELGGTMELAIQNLGKIIIELVEDLRKHY